MPRSKAPGSIDSGPLRSRRSQTATPPRARKKALRDESAERDVPRRARARSLLARSRAVIAELREHSPVYWLAGFDAWVVTRHEDVRMLFSDPRVTADPRPTSATSRPAISPPSAGWRRCRSARSTMPSRASDASRSAAFTPRAVARMEQSVVDVVEELAAPLRGRSGVVDLLASSPSRSRALRSAASSACRHGRRGGFFREARPKGDSRDQSAPPPCEARPDRRPESRWAATFCL
jgi:hypothetical protein